MPHAPDPRPHREFPREGYTLYYDRDGVELRVDDYHARPLKLSWSSLEALQREAQRTRAAGED
jgi:hypothetical protein